MTNLLAIATVTLSSSLRARCEAPKRWVNRDDGYGGQEIEAPWCAPAEVPLAMKREAEIAARAAEDACKPAPKDLVEKWLASLGMLCAGSTPAAEARAKVGAYSSLLDFPSACYTKDTLRAAAETFKWLPSFAELSGHLGSAAQPLYALRDRLRGIADARPAIAKPVEPQSSPEEMAAARERGAEMLRQCAASLRVNESPEDRPKRPRYLRDGPPPEEMREWLEQQERQDP